MRIVLLSPYTNPIKGGITSYTRELIDSYRQMGNEAEGLVVEGHTDSRFTALGPSSIAFSIRAFLRLAAVKPEIVHAHSHWRVLLPGFLYRKIRPRTRLLFTFHTMPVSRGTGLGDLTLRVMLSACDGVTFVSRDLQDTISLPPSTRQAVVHPAPERVTFESVPATGGTEEPMVVFVGPLTWPRKAEGVGHLIEAFSAVAQSHPRWRLSIVGDGPLRGVLEEKVRGLGLSGKIEFRGQVENAIDVIAHSQVYAQISLQEGLPLSLLNAMALGKPVIATAVGGMQEVIIDGVTGRLVPPSVKAIADGLLELLADETERRRLGRAARDWVAKELSWEKVASRHLQICGKA